MTVARVKRWRCSITRCKAELTEAEVADHFCQEHPGIAIELLERRMGPTGGADRGGTIYEVEAV